MKIKTVDNMEDVILIKDSSIDVEKIISSIKREIKEKRVAYLMKLTQNLPSVIDTVDNNEYLLDGWYENEVVGEKVARWTSKSFGVLYNCGETGRINIEIVSTPPELENKPIEITMFVNEKKSGEKIIRVSGKQILDFNIADQYLNKNIELNFKLSRTFKPVSDGKGADVRELGLAIRKISNMNLTEIGEKYLTSVTGLISKLPFELDRIKYHTNPENLLPGNTRAGFIKKQLLRLMRVYTNIQVGYNVYTHEFLTNISEIMQKFQKYIMFLDGKLFDLEKRQKGLENYIGKENIQLNESKYWEQEKDKLYVFHQNFFRGSNEQVSELLKIYLEYLPVNKFFDNNIFYDMGCGRGEFLDLLTSHNIKNIGVDNNSISVNALKVRGLDVVNSDALDYLEKISQAGGISAFHLLEHFSFPMVFDFLYLAYKKLIKGGIIIIETPNPNNLIVGSNNFYYDFTHITKLPPKLLEKTFEYVGFRDVKIVYLHEMVKGELNDSEKMIYGPQDYGIIAYK